MKETYQILAWLYNYNIKSDVIKINFFKFESTLLTGLFTNRLANSEMNFWTSQRISELHNEVWSITLKSYSWNRR